MWNLILLGVGFFHYGGDYWHSKWSLLLALLIALLGIRIGLKVAWSAGVCFIWTALSSLYLFAWRDNYVQGLPKLEATSMDANSAYSLVAFLSLSWFFVVTSECSISNIRKAFGWACLADSAYTILCAAQGGGSVSVGGFFDQYSMNGCFIAVTAPFAEEILRKGRNLFEKSIRLLPFVAIILIAVISKTRSLYLVTFVVVMVPVLSNRFTLKQKAALFVCLFFFLHGLFAVSFLRHSERIWTSSGRFPMWAHTFRWLFSKPAEYWFFGLGNGSFPVMGPGIQNILSYTAYSSQWWLWLHSDWLQTLFEQGIIGLGLYLWLAWDSIRRAADFSLLAALLGFIVMALFQYPFHLPLTAFLGAFLIASSLRRVSPA